MIWATTLILSQTDSNTGSLPRMLKAITQYGTWAQAIVREEN